MAEPEVPALEPGRGEKEHEPDRATEQDRRRDLREELSEQKRQGRISAENLDALYADTVIAGDDIGGASHRATDGGTVNAVGRDQYVFGWRPEDAAVHTVEMSAQEVAMVRRCHVRTDSWRRLSVRLRHEHVLVLRGAPHSGQPATALVALAEWARDDDHLAWLQITADPFRLTSAALRKATGYLLQAGDDGAWSRHPDQVLGHLCRAAERADARIVVLAGPGFPGHDLTVDHDPPPLDQVFVKRLVHELRQGRDARPQERADKAAADELVRGKLAEYRHPRQARELALQVAAGLLLGRSLDEILEALPEQRRRKARMLLARETPRRARCFMIASAVLRGSPAAVVATQTVRLATLVEEELARQTTVEQPRRHHVWEWINDWTGDTGIRVEQSGRGGDGPVVGFDEPRMAGTILRVVWEEQPTIHEPLLTWLHELSEDGDPDTGRRAAEAVGLLATFDFPSIQRRFLRRWRDGDRSEGRELAAWALASAARDPQVQPRVLDCLRSWARSGRRAQSVVIRTYGSWLGAYRLDEALRVLGDVAKTSGSILVGGVARAVSQIHQLGAGRTFLYTGDDGVPENTRKIVAALAEWSGDPDWRGRHRAAALAFVRLLASPDAIRVIDLAADPGAQADLVTLWRHILDEAVGRDSDVALTPEAWSLLGDWLARWETDAGVRQVLTRVLTRLRADARTSLAFRLRLWRRIRKIDAGLAARLTELIEGS
ncbi:hypothetical protein [Microbispora sp. NPDC046933]|uniref:hypothetical protein n=1 Tax=Microbispora sp. NPDC046933 TaxID=3155618 RepID=UPI0033EECE18